MGKKKQASIDALFGSKTRVKLLHLFLNNPGKSFYVREITRLIDEQINSVRRELANMMSVGIVLSDTADNKLYYRVNDNYEYYTPFRAMFSDEEVISKGIDTKEDTGESDWVNVLKDIKGIRVAVAAGILVRGSASPVDLLLVTSVSKPKIAAAVRQIESSEGRELNYAVLSYDEFYYRLSVRDKFITEIFSSKHAIIIDTDNVLSGHKEKG